MAKQFALKAKQRLAALISVAFAVAAVFMGLSVYADLSVNGGASTATIVFKVVSVGVSVIFCVANIKMASSAKKELKGQSVEGQTV